MKGFHGSSLNPI